MNNDSSQARRPASRGTLTLRTVVILALVVMVVGAIVAFSYVQVCNQQVTSSGHIVEVCRHLEATDPPIIVGGLVILALLGVFFTEISGFGFTLKREVAQVKNAVTDTQGDVAQVKNAVADAQGAASSALSSAKVAQDLSLRKDTQRSRPMQEQSRLEQEISSLAREYDNTRKKMAAGADRTSKMESIMASMISILNDVEPSVFEAPYYLGSEDEGERLAGYAYLYANPVPQLTQQIADGLMKNKPFAQYWALRTLRRQIQADPDCLDLNTKRNLEELLQQLPPETDRAYELRALLREISK